VTDCDFGLTLEGVAITVRIDKGVSAAGYIGVPDTTDAAGKMRIVLNQPDSDVVTIGLDKTGYQPWSHGRPRPLPARPEPRSDAQSDRGSRRADHRGPER
jgi:hypothetical protein